MIEIILNGYSGKMGKLILSLVIEDQRFRINSKFDDQLKISKIIKGDIIIDFSSNKGFESSLDIAEKKQIPFLSGTTAISQENLSKMKNVSKTIPLFYSPNMSLGINIIKKIIKENLNLFNKYEVEIVEAHHNKKKDAPSGTALLLASLFNNDTPVHSIRLGDIPGDHSVIFASDGEVIKLSHRATSRKVFAKGTLEIAQWLIDQQPGLYSMEDFLKNS